MTHSPEGDFFPPPEAQTSEYNLPPEALVGDDLVTALREALVDRSRTHDTPPEVIERIVKHATEWVEAIKPGEPTLVLDWERGILLFRDGGVVRGPLYIVSHSGYLELCIPSARIDESGVLRDYTLKTSVSTLAFVYEDSPAPPSLFVAGEEAVRAHMAMFGGEIYKKDLPHYALTQRARFLERLSRSNLPLEYLNLDEETRLNLCNALLEAFVLETNYEHTPLRNALQYVADIRESEQLAALHDVIEDQWAEMLPLSPDDSDRTAFYAVMMARRYHPIAEELKVGLPVDFKFDEGIHRASVVADLYERRAAIEHARGTEATEVALPDITLAEPPEPRDLAIFHRIHPKPDEILADIAYMRALKASGYPVTLAIERDEQKMKKGIDHLANLANNVQDPTQRLEVFDAMEFLFDLKTGLQRDELYRLLCERYALNISLNGSWGFISHLRVAETMGQLMPNPPTAEDGEPYSGTARTAAIMGRLYRRRAFQLRLKQLRRYRPLAENEESSSDHPQSWYTA